METRKTGSTNNRQEVLAEMPRRHLAHADREGGRKARPLGAAPRIALTFLAAALLAFALHQTMLSESGEGTSPSLLALFDGVSGDQGGAEGRSIDWAELPEAVVAWVEVPGTSIDESIAQATADASGRYLHVDALERRSYGTPYLDWECTPESAFSIVYGHHMDDGSVFADFARFSDRAYAEGHRDILVWTCADGEMHELRVVAADVVDASDERVQVTFANDEERAARLGERISQSDLALEEPDPSVSKVWAFVTCSYQTWNSRTVVYAVEDRR